MKSRAALLTFLLVVCTTSAQALQGAPVASHGETRVTALVQGLDVQVRVLTHELAIGSSSDPRPKHKNSSCTYSVVPCSVVDDLRMTVNGKDLFVPRSAFCDLSDLNSVSILPAKNVAEVVIRGGDASESFVARIEIDSKRVRRRSRASSLQPDSPSQETIFHVVRIGE